MSGPASLSHQIELVLVREIEAACPLVRCVPRLLQLPEGLAMGYSLTPMLSDDPTETVIDGARVHLTPGVLQVDMMRTTHAVLQPMVQLADTLRNSFPGRRLSLTDEGTLALRRVEQIRPDRQRGDIHYVTLTFGLRVTTLADVSAVHRHV